jgi:hypothetical protein
MAETEVLNPPRASLDPQYAITEGLSVDPVTPTRTAQRITEAMVTLVKGAGYAVTDKQYASGAIAGANQPLSDPDKVFSRAQRAETEFRQAIDDGYSHPADVIKSLSPEFGTRLNSAIMNSPQQLQWNMWTQQLQSQIQQFTGKNFTLTSPNATGLVPYNLN